MEKMTTLRANKLPLKVRTLRTTRKLRGRNPNAGLSSARSRLYSSKKQPSSNNYRQQS